MRRYYLPAVVSLLVTVSSCATLASAAIAPDGSVCPASNPPNTLSIAGGTPQSALLGSAFASPLVVALANTDGCPVTTPLAGVAVAFAAPSSGASGIFASSGSGVATVGTDATGVATAPQLTPNGIPGDYFVVASSVYGAVDFALVNTSRGIPLKVVPLSLAKSSVTVSTGYPSPLHVRVLDETGAPVVGATVTFTLGVPGGADGSGAEGSGPGATFPDGSLQATATTDADGIATSPHFSANAIPGTFSATATVPGVPRPAEFSLHNHPGAPPRLRPLGPVHRSAEVGARYTAPLRARLTSAGGRPVEGTTVTFTLDPATSGGPTAGGSGAPTATFPDGSAEATATTDAEGIARSPRLVANTVGGVFTATASAAGGSAAARFRLENEPGRPHVLTAGAAANESGEIGTRFIVPLAVMATDKYGNPVARVLVTFTAPAHGAGGGFVGAHGGTSQTIRVRTGDHGVAVAPAFAANRTEGGYVVKAAVRGVGRAAFALVNLSRDATG